MIYSIIFNVVLLIALVTSLRKLYSFGLTMLKMQDTIEESLDILDERYKSISLILQKPVFFDSLEVRQVLDDIDAARQAILYIANKLNIVQETDVDVKKENN